jgi:hypothetical protein
LKHVSAGSNPVKGTNYNGDIMRKVTVYVNPEDLASGKIDSHSVRVFIQILTSEQESMILNDTNNDINEANEPYHWEDKPANFNLANWYLIGD